MSFCRPETPCEVNCSYIFFMSSGERIVEEYLVDVVLGGIVDGGPSTGDFAVPLSPLFSQYSVPEDAHSQRVYSNLDQEEEVAPVQLSPGHFCGGFCGQRGVIFDIFKFQ